MPESVLVLVVEDEPAIQVFLEDVLEDAGFTVCATLKGEEALRILDRPDFAPVGIVTDIRLGSGVKGWEVARAARERHPDIAVVYITGDSAADWTAHGVPRSILVHKPFVAAQVVTAMTSLLNGQVATL